MKALIIEDDEGACEALRTILQPFTSELRVAKNMTEVLQAIAEASKVELIILDLGLPDSMVEESILHITEIRDRCPNSLLIVLTRQEITDLEDRVIAQGADGLIKKQGDGFSRMGFLKLMSGIV